MLNHHHHNQSQSAFGSNMTKLKDKNLHQMFQLIKVDLTENNCWMIGGVLRQNFFQIPERKVTNLSISITKHEACCKKVSRQDFKTREKAKNIN